MSLQQRIRAFKFAVEEKKKQLASSPPISTIVAAIAAVRAAFQPLFDLLSKLQEQWEAVGEAYNQFLAEETKSKWTWSKRNKKELALLAAFPPYTLGKKKKKTAEIYKLLQNLIVSIDSNVNSLIFSMCSVSTYLDLPSLHPSELSVLLDFTLVLFLGDLGPVVGIASVYRDRFDGSIEVCAVGMGIFLVGMARNYVIRGPRIHLELVYQSIRYRGFEENFELKFSWKENCLYLAL